MSDTDVLRAASKSLSALPMASAPDVQAIMARGRARRRRRLSAVAGLSAAAAAGTALALGLTGILGPSAARSTGTIRTASFTLVGNANGTATLTINPSELVDAAALQKDLQQYGIPAMVTSGRFCSSAPALASFSQVVSFYPRPTASLTLVPSGIHPTVIFNPSAMPAGTKLSFGIFQLSPREQQDDFVLVNSSSYTCTSTPPGPPPDGAQFRMIRPGS